MPLTPGTRVGVYEVEGLVGAGGMGEVYRARDTRLDRSAALKTLPDEFARDAERLARFEREARTLAQLSHPHIASIYGLEAGNPPALAMEMVEGETLFDRIAAGPIPLEEALAIARQIAEALEHAHGLGIVHRDLKPANVKVGDRDAAPKVKVLDFGLAKAMLTESMSGSSPSAVSSPTITSPANMTRAGVILGTAAYMAPEQARGKLVDQRADIWAFGCVLFEMITARRAFPGDETPDVLARVIQSDPDWKLIPVSTPPAVVTLLHRCLRKDPSRRLHSIADVRIDLEELAAGGTDQAEARAAAPSRSPWPFALAGLALGAAVTAAVTLTLFRPAAPAPAPAPVLRFAVSLPDGWLQHRNLPNGRLAFAVSPDGQKLTAVALGKDGVRRVLVRRFDESAFRELPGTDGALAVFWAPDSSRLAFATPDGTVRRTDLSGTGSQPIATQAVFGGAAWSARDEIIAAGGTGRPLMRWPVGGSPQPLGELPTGVVARLGPSWLPDGESYTFLEAKGPQDYSLLLQPPGKPAQTLAVIESQGAGTATALFASGHVLVSRVESSGRSILTAQPFDLTNSRTTGDVTALVSNVNPVFSVSRNGVLVYGEGRFATERLYWLDAHGAEAAPPSDRLEVSNFDLSPDERSLVLQGAGQGLHLYDLTRGVSTQLHKTGVDPVWSPDGKSVAFAVAGLTEQGVFVMPAFGGAARRVYEASGPTPTYIDGWSSDGAWLAGHVGGATGHGILIPLAEGAKPIQFEETSTVTGVDEARFSPDGRWLIYCVTTTGSSDVFLIPFPPTGERWQISRSGGAQPRWRADGRALYFLSMSGTMMTVDLSLKPGTPPQIGAPRALFETGVQVLPNYDQYAVNKDGTRFLVRRPDEVGRLFQNQLQVIVNWPGLLKK